MHAAVPTCRKASGTEGIVHDILYISRQVSTRQLKSTRRHANYCKGKIHWHNIGVYLTNVLINI